MYPTPACSGPTLFYPGHITAHVIQTLAANEWEGEADAITPRPLCWGDFLPCLKLQDLACTACALMHLGLDETLFWVGRGPVHCRVMSGVSGRSHWSVTRESVFSLAQGLWGPG